MLYWNRFSLLALLLCSVTVPTGCVKKAKDFSRVKADGFYKPGERSNEEFAKSLRDTVGKQLPELSEVNDESLVKAIHLLRTRTVQIVTKSSEELSIGSGFLVGSIKNGRYWVYLSAGHVLSPFRPKSKSSTSGTYSSGNIFQIQTNEESWPERSSEKWMKVFELTGGGVDTMGSVISYFSAIYNDMAILIAEPRQAFNVEGPGTSFAKKFKKDTTPVLLGAGYPGTTQRSLLTRSETKKEVQSKMKSICAEFLKKVLPVEVPPEQKAELVDQLELNKISCQLGLNKLEKDDESQLPAGDHNGEGHSLRLTAGKSLFTAPHYAITDLDSFLGMSGGPVLDMETGRIVGINTSSGVQFKLDSKNDSNPTKKNSEVLSGVNVFHRLTRAKTDLLCSENIIPSSERELFNEACALVKGALFGP